MRTCGLVAMGWLLLSMGVTSFASADEAGAAIEPRELVQGDQTVWLYAPDGAASGLVVVPPAGGTLLTAAGLGPGDRPEHVPYVKAGFAVVSFSISGELSGRVTPSQVDDAIRQFADAQAGVLDAQAAIETALRALPELRSKPILAAGHSSAANLVLALTAQDPRIEAVVAYAPAADAVAFIAGSGLENRARSIPGALERVAELSPIALASRLSVPVMLFQADDDDVTSVAATRELAQRLEARGCPVRLLTVTSGGHYDAMIESGIPAAIPWLKEQLARAPTGRTCRAAEADRPSSDAASPSR